MPGKRRVRRDLSVWLIWRMFVTIDDMDDRIAADVFRRLVRHLRHRADAENIDLMGLAGFCRNCLGDWAAEASNGALSRDDGRELVYGMPYSEWKARHQKEATPEQLARMAESMKLNEERA
jgi:uncharacterized protein